MVEKLINLERLQVYKCSLFNHKSQICLVIRDLHGLLKRHATCEMHPTTSSRSHKLDKIGCHFPMLESISVALNAKQMHALKIMIVSNESIG